MNLGPIKDKTVPERKSFKKILGKQGAYALVISCLGIIAITAALSLSLPNNPSSQATQEAALPAKTSAPAATKSSQADKPSATAKNDTTTSGDSTVDAPVAGSMLLPVNATTMVRGYAEDILVFSNTLKQWSTHLGVDITAAEGEEVFCVLDGTVESITQDALMGNQIVISHADGYKTVYAALKTVNSELTQGSTVKRGQVIATVGNTAVSEIEDGAHLHFEVYKNDAHVNPESYLSGLTK